MCLEPVEICLEPGDDMQVDDTQTDVHWYSSTGHNNDDNDDEDDDDSAESLPAAPDAPAKRTPRPARDPSIYFYRYGPALGIPVHYTLLFIMNTCALLQSAIDAGRPSILDDVCGCMRYLYSEWRKGITSETCPGMTFVIWRRMCKHAIKSYAGGLLDRGVVSVDSVVDTGATSLERRNNRAMLLACTIISMVHNQYVRLTSVAGVPTLVVIDTDNFIRCVTHVLQIDWSSAQAPFTFQYGTCEWGDLFLCRFLESRFAADVTPHHTEISLTADIVQGRLPMLYREKLKTRVLGPRKR